MLKFLIVLGTAGLITLSTSKRLNASHKVEKCKNRRVDFEIYDKKYFFNGYLDDIAQPVSWSQARDSCKSYCTDLISVNYEEEYIVMRDLMHQLDVDYFWTAGHVCERDQCGEKSLPININGWRWVDTNERMPPTNTTPPGWTFNPWSHTGFNKVQQPDNAEYAVTGKNESCMAVLHNVYDDGVKFHDVACYHPKNFICEYYADEDDDD